MKKTTKKTNLKDTKNGKNKHKNSPENANKKSNKDSAIKNKKTISKKDTTTTKSVNKKKKSPFAGLKDQIMSELKPHEKTESDSEKKSRKIDMGFLKSTVEDSLKATPTPEAESKKNIERAATGIEGFDETVEGGLVKNSVTLVCGGPGSGKSIFAMQTLVNGIEKYGEHGVYITFEEEVETLLADMKRFGWDLEEKIKNRQLSILYYSPEQVDRVLYIGGGPVREVIDEINAKRIVIDSITAFTMLYKSENQRRKALLSLFNILKRWDCTSLLVSEQTVNPEKHESKLEEYQAEGIIYMYHTKKEDVRERSIEVFKMRGTDHSTKINPLKISHAGITVYPEENVY